MKKLIPLTALVLGLSGGVALADRGHDHGGRATVDHRGGNTVVREHGRGNVVVREHNTYNRGNVVVRDRGGWNNHGGGRVIVRNENWHRGGYVRRPIYVSRPYIGTHYYNRWSRPALIVENYGPRDGYFWVPGAWTWNGAEWIWYPGHYQPDPNYVGAYYGEY
jgi:hypothetical protein